jgi:tRNA A-37 threonylcarbamoyl transferase component Bud32
VKVFDFYDDFACADFVREVDAYMQLQPLQGSCIPEMLTVGRLPHSGHPVLAVRLGEPVHQPVTPAVAAGIRHALKQLHAAGAAHGDVRLQNMLMQPGEHAHVLLCDLERCILRANDEALAADEQELESLLQP